MVYRPVPWVYEYSDGVMWQTMSWNKRIDMSGTCMIEPATQTAIYIPMASFHCQTEMSSFLSIITKSEGSDWLHALTGKVGC